MNLLLFVRRVFRHERKKESAREQAIYQSCSMPNSALNLNARARVAVFNMARVLKSCSICIQLQTNANCVEWVQRHGMTKSDVIPNNGKK